MYCTHQNYADIGLCGIRKPFKHTKSLLYWRNHLHAKERKINGIHDSGLAYEHGKPDNGTTMVDQILFKEKKLK